MGAESAPTFTIWGQKAPPYIINDGFNGKIKEAYEKYENIIFSGFSTLNFVLSTMAGLALRENDIGYARFLSGKVQAVAHTLEMGKYNEYSPMLDIVCAGKDVEGTYKVVKHLLDNVGTMYDFIFSINGSPFLRTPCGEVNTIGNVQSRWFARSHLLKMKTGT